MGAVYSAILVALFVKRLIRGRIGPQRLWVEEVLHCKVFFFFSFFFFHQLVVSVISKFNGGYLCS